MLRKTNTSLT